MVLRSLKGLPVVGCLPKMLDWILQRLIQLSCHSFNQTKLSNCFLEENYRLICLFLATHKLRKTTRWIRYSSKTKIRQNFVILYLGPGAIQGQLKSTADKSNVVTKPIDWLMRWIFIKGFSQGSNRLFGTECQFGNTSTKFLKRTKLHTVTTVVHQTVCS